MDFIGFDSRQTVFKQERQSKNVKSKGRCSLSRVAIASFGFNPFCLEKELRHIKVNFNFFQPLRQNGPMDLLHFFF